MLYTSELERLYPKVKLAVKELFKAAYKNQTDKYDLLLIIENGYYDESIEKLNIGKKRHKKLSPFAIGPHYQHYAEITQFKFYNTYRHAKCINTTRSSFLSSIKNTPGESQYSLDTQVEMMIYLKFWEANRILERLYKLTKLALGEPYNWYYKIKKEDSRHDIIRNKIREPIKTICPNFYKLIKEIYLSQIRNATAHSQFFIIGLDINFLNFDPKNHAPLDILKIEDWEERFHLLTLLYNEYIRYLNIYHYLYKREARGKHFGLPLRIIDTSGKQKESWYHYIEEMDRWQWYESWKKGLKLFTII